MWRVSNSEPWGFTRPSTMPSGEVENYAGAILAARSSIASIALDFMLAHLVPALAEEEVASNRGPASHKERSEWVDSFLSSPGAATRGQGRRGGWRPYFHPRRCQQ